MTVKPIVLVGLSGSGKSALVSELASQLGRPAVDLDSLIVETEGRTIADVFADRGEEYFRQVEHDVLVSALAHHPDAVIAAGGGLVTQAENRQILADSCRTVWLNPPLSEIAQRLSQDDEVRPLLRAEGSLAALYADRIGFYSVAADVISTSVGTSADIATEVIAAVVPLERQDDGDEAVDYRTETVHLADGRTYPVLIGRNIVDRLGELLPDKVKKVAVITQAGIGVVVDPGVEHRVFTVEDGEQAKRLEVVGDLASQLASWGLTRGDAVVSVGGGVVSDVAGFLAASYHRGIPVVHVSTTLLGQIDAAIGGKTGVNLPEGKNLFGAFWQPSGVICDVGVLATLPVREFRAGMGELAKYHFLGGGDLDQLPLIDRVAACVRIKADVVAADEREGGRRAILNYGHTLAHALETAGQYDLRHGEAVSIGLVYAAELACLLGRIDADAVLEHRRVVEAYGLNGRLEADVDNEEILSLFSRDKKAVDGITFVLDGPNGVEPVIVEDRAVLVQALEAVKA